MAAAERGGFVDVWRDFNGDFGEHLLQRHLLQHPHQSASLLSK
jgi:hypothetical protein